VVKRAIRDFSYDTIDRLRVVKILYLIDRKLKNQQDIKFTQFNYIKHNLGPFTGDITSELENLIEEGILEHSDNIYYIYKISEIPEDFNDIENRLEEKLIMIDDSVKEIFELARDKTELLNYVEGLPEVKETHFGAEINF